VSALHTLGGGPDKPEAMRALRFRRLWAAISFAGALALAVATGCVLGAWSPRTENDGASIAAASIGHQNSVSGSAVTCHSTSTSCGTAFQTVTLSGGNVTVSTASIVLDAPPASNSTAAQIASVGATKALCSYLSLTVTSGGIQVGATTTLAALGSSPIALSGWTAGSTQAYQLQVAMSSSAPQSLAGAANACTFNLTWSQFLGPSGGRWSVTTTNPNNSIALAVQGVLSTIQMNHLTSSAGYPAYRFSWAATQPPSGADMWTCAPSLNPGCTALPGAAGSTQHNTAASNPGYAGGQTTGGLCTDNGTPPSGTNPRNPGICGWYSRPGACPQTYCFDSGYALTNNITYIVRVRLYFGSPTNFTDNTVTCTGSANNWTCT
jgi:hypothetical protein